MTIFMNNVLQKAQKQLEEKLKITIKNPSLEIRQDPDVLDTWFSSALIPLSVQGWPDSEVCHASCIVFLMQHTSLWKSSNFIIISHLLRISNPSHSWRLVLT